MKYFESEDALMLSSMASRLLLSRRKLLTGNMPATGIGR